MMAQQKAKGMSLLGLIFLLLMLLPVLGIALLILYFSGMMFLSPFLLMLYLFFGLFFLSRRLWSKRKQIIVNYTALICLLLAIIYALPGIYDQTRPVVQPANVDLFAYQPFGENTKAVGLDEPATFRIAEDLPMIDGATAFYPVYASFAQAVYPEDEYHPYDSEVMSNRTGFAYEYLIEGRADLIFVLGPSAEQVEAAEKAGVTFQLTPIAKEAFVFFVHDKNPVTNVTMEEIKDIYAGEITNWREVEGKNKSIRAFQRDANSGSQTALERLMGDRPIMDPPTEDIASLMGTMIDVVTDYKNYQNAIGFTFRYYSTEMIKNHEIRLLHVDGVAPTVESIASGDYPITDEIYAVTTATTNPHVEEFINWIRSEQGQQIIEKAGYVPIQ